MEKIFNEYILILLWIGIIAFIAKKNIRKKNILVLGHEEERFSLVFAIVSIIPLIFMVANRDLSYGDSGAYLNSFMNMPNELSEMGQYLEKHVTKDYGFAIFSIIIRSLISEDYVIYFFIIAAIQGISLISVYRKYSMDFVFSLFLFIISADYISWMCNGIRQFLAVTIIFAATTLMLKKKYLSVFAIIYFASFFHRSALIMLPIVIILQGKAWNKKTLSFIVLVLLSIVFIGQFTDVLDFSMADSQYKNVVTDYTEMGDNGTHPLRALVYAVPSIIAFIGRKEIRESDNHLIHFCTNASLISTGLYAISMFTSGIFLGRLPIYVSLYNYILLPWEIKHVIPEHLRKTVITALLILYFIFYYYQVSFTWGLF